MTCYRPIPLESDRFARLRVPCGQCVGCRLDRSRHWAMRCVHEASLYDRNCFVTLTYSDDHLSGWSLVYRDFQLFMKRLRKRFSCRYFMCGEYGEDYSRPHFHACLFGLDFPDKVVYKESKEVKLFTSKILDDLWGKGMCTVGAVTFESAAYVARYLMKKEFGKDAGFKRSIIDPSSGEIFFREHEFAHMSRRPWIGRDWIRLYWPEVLREGQVVVDGIPVDAPRAYLKYLREMDGFEAVKERRQERAIRFAADSTPARRQVRESVALARLKQLKRSL